MSLKTTLIAIFSLSLLFTSCKKDKLEGEYEVLKGKWEWSYTKVYYQDGSTTNNPPIDTILAGECYDNYELDFLEKGIVKRLKNRKVKCRKRIVFERVGVIPQSGDLSIIMHLNNNDSKDFSVRIRENNPNLLITLDEDFTGLPFEDTEGMNAPGDNIDTLYTHYYERVD